MFSKACTLLILLSTSRLSEAATITSLSNVLISPCSEKRPLAHRLNGRTLGAETLNTWNQRMRRVGAFCCPIAECNKQYTTARGLTCHIRKSADPEHSLIQPMSVLVVSNECPICRNRFYRSYVNGYCMVQRGPNLGLRIKPKTSSVHTTAKSSTPSTLYITFSVQPTTSSRSTLSHRTFGGIERNVQRWLSHHRH